MRQNSPLGIADSYTPRPATRPLAHGMNFPHIDQNVTQPFSAQKFGNSIGNIALGYAVKGDPHAGVQEINPVGIKPNGTPPPKLARRA